MSILINRCIFRFTSLRAHRTYIPLLITSSSPSYHTTVSSSTSPFPSCIPASPILKTSKRQLCTSSSSPQMSEDGTMSEHWAEHEFTGVADHSLESISELIASVGYDQPSTSDDFDVDLSQGVLTIRLGPEIGTYVLNTQTPNRQIWMSSPVSGPWRYAWHPSRREWLSTRDGHLLSQRLSEEFTQALHHPISIQF